MAYWIYNMGLPIAVKHNVLLQKKNIKAISNSSKNNSVKDTEHMLALDVIEPNPINQKKHTIQAAYADTTEQAPQLVVTARDIMSSPVASLPVTTKFSDAWHMFQQKRFRYFPVTNNDNKLIGIISDRDMLTSALFTKSDSGLNHPNPTIANTMIRTVITASANTNIHEICQVMLSQHIGAVPIMTEEGLIQGIITRSDILRILIKHPTMSLWA
jgi:acetoin utilization protein AcuB